MSEKNYIELKKSLDLKSIENLYFLTGDTDLVSYFEKRLICEILGKNYTDFDITVLKSENISNEKIQSALETFPITTLKKCVILKDIPWESLENEDINLIIKIISDIPEFCVLIIIQSMRVYGTKHSQKLTKIKNFVKKHGIFSNLSQEDFPMEKQLILWASRDFNKKLNSYIAKKILNLCKGYQIHEIKNELKKICEFEKENEITDKSLNIIWKSEEKISIFNISKAIFSLDISKCFETISSLLGQNEEPSYILNIIIMEFIDIFRVKLFIENNKDFLELAKIFDYKNKEFRLKNAEKFSRKLSLEDLTEIFKFLISADEKLKTTKIDPEIILTELIMLIIKKMT